MREPSLAHFSQRHKISCGTGLEAGPDVGYADAFAKRENLEFNLASEPDQPKIVFPGLSEPSCLSLD